MTCKSRVILLNGPGSAGKSSIARSLQGMTREPYLHVAMDAFLDMLPDAYQEHAETFRYERAEEDGHPAIAIHTGPRGARLMAGMRAAIAALCNEDNNLIVDDVMLAEEKALADYRRRLIGHDLKIVGVHAPLDVLERRERSRGDRLIGLARWQFPRVHAGIAYDLSVDTSRMTAVDCARRIRDQFDL
jgi:chloramphenicol 3-O phosphotransferase